MIDLEQFEKNAKKDNLCSEYTKKWENCKSNKQFFDMGTSSKGLDYLCDSIAKGWGLSKEVLLERFKPFINGLYVNQCDGYTSCLYVGYNMELKIDTTLVGLIDCDIDIEIPEYQIAKVYCTGNNKIRVSGKGELIFICYGSKGNTRIEGTCGNMKRIDKKNRDTYE